MSVHLFKVTKVHKSTITGNRSESFHYYPSRLDAIGYISRQAKLEAARYPDTFSHFELDDYRLVNSERVFFADNGLQFDE